MAKPKVAFITGITGQDGSYLAELLLTKGYQVVGLSHPNDSKLMRTNLDRVRDRLTLVQGDLNDRKLLEKTIATQRPTEIYNLAGVTFVPKAWQEPQLTFEVNTQSVATLLTLIVRLSPETRFYQASSSKMFGRPAATPQTEHTPLAPTDPYSISKTAGHFLVDAYRQHHGIFAVSGILYNHESERRGLEFVTRKISHGAAAIKLGYLKKLELGTLTARQDWGYAPDYVDAMWRMLAHDKPEDFIIATGITHSVQEVCEIAFGALDLPWEHYVIVAPDLKRKTESNHLIGDSTKAKQLLDWQPTVSFREMIEKMVRFDYEMLLKEHHG